MSDTTDRYALPLLQVAQAQKEVTHNEAIAALDALVHLAVETATLAAPPASPVAGQAWIVAAAPSGAWAGHAGEIAHYSNAGWRFTAAREGCIAWRRDLQRFIVRTASGWRDDGWPAAGVRIGTRLALSGTPDVVPAASGGGVVDIELRASVALLLAALRGQGVVS